jgi:hypothetical protein
VLLRALLPVAAGRPVVGSNLRAFHLVESAGVCIGALGGAWLARTHGVSDVVEWAAGPWLVAAISVVAIRRAAVVTAIATESDKWLDAA